MKKAQKETLVLIRVNPALDAKVHPYNSTALSDSKFGVEQSQIDKVIFSSDIQRGEFQPRIFTIYYDLQVLSILKSTPLVKLVGLHCHIGSTISDTSVYKDVAKLFMDMVQMVTFT